MLHQIPLSATGTKVRAPKSSPAFAKSTAETGGTSRLRDPFLADRQLHAFVRQGNGCIVVRASSPSDVPHVHQALDVLVGHETTPRGNDLQLPRADDPAVLFGDVLQYRAVIVI